MNEFDLCVMIWGLMLFSAVLIDYHIIRKRIDPKAVEARYQAYRKAEKEKREIENWKRWGLAINGQTLEGNYVKPKIEDWVR